MSDDDKRVGRFDNRDAAKEPEGSFADHDEESRPKDERIGRFDDRDARKEREGSFSDHDQ
jgi:hypothetical protein